MDSSRKEIKEEEMTKQPEDDECAYRWLLVNNQETCFMSIVKLIDGYHVSAEEAKASCPDYSFKECLFMVSKIEGSNVPCEWLNIYSGVQ